MRVLVVDDDATTLLVLKTTLTSFGYEVDTAKNGAEAWDLLRREEIPIVITDLEMPVSDGLHLCSRVRSTELERYVYVVLLTHHAERKNLLTAFSSGADDFVAKPPDPEQLRVRLIVAQRIVTLEKELRETNLRLLKRNECLELLSRVDALTGAGNRAAFQEQIEYAHARALRSGRPYGIIVCDLDRFKQINDQLGHQAGDRALVGVVAAVRNTVRKGDVVFRYGGDEIVLVVPDEGAETMAGLAERLCAAVEQTTLTDEDGQPFQLTTSLGVAAYPESCGEGADWAEVFALADEAMYVAKRRGGNGVSVALLPPKSQPSSAPSSAPVPAGAV